MSHAHPHSFILPGKEAHVVRFTVGQAHGPRSGIWRLWTNPNGSDVFFALQGAADSKTSFHASGVWRDAEISTPPKSTRRRKVVRAHRYDDPRLITRWQRPTHGAGWTRGIDLVVAEPDVHGPSDGIEPDQRPTIFISPPPKNFSTYVSVFWAAPDAERPNEPPRLDVEYLALVDKELPNGDRLWIITYDLPLDVAPPIDLPSWKRRLREEAIGGIGSDEPARLVDLRGDVWFTRPDKSRFVVDMALDVPPEAYTT